MKATTFIAKGIFFCPVAVNPIKNAGCWTNTKQQIVHSEENLINKETVW